MDQDRLVDEEKDASAGSSSMAGEAPDSFASLSGRELDAAVAERVMGWKRELRAWYDPRGNSAEIYQVPRYSSDIVAAMEVVEKLKEWNFTLLLNRAIAPEVGQWVAWFENFITGATVHVGAQTSAEAICLAALKTQDTNTAVSAGTTVPG